MLLHSYVAMTLGERLRSRRAFEELASMLTDEDLEAILESSREFRKGFAFRTWPKVGAGA